MFYYDYRGELKNDSLNDAEWRHMEDIIKGLQPFHEVTLHLEGLARQAHYGAI